MITEFINHVGWDREPWCTINAASMHHIYEGRWLKDNRYLDGYINYLYQQGGNNRQYSESIADATYARYLVNADSAFVLQQLDSMKSIYEGWKDHYDSSKNLYYIPAMPDATEYTIASIDASGGKDGFEDGEAFRPTINSYQYGNAMAISRIAAIKGDNNTEKIYANKAAVLKANVENDLWNDSLKHFTDRFKVDNKYVHYWDFIRGRELAGFAPWYFNLPSDDQKYFSSWRHAMDTAELLGQYGFRTNEPSYEYYFRQYVYTFGRRGSQWNGPSWPYQSSQALTGMANLLNNYRQQVITPSDYLDVLRKYTMQHYLPDGKINLVENYDPNIGGPIVYYYWSNHYNHSTFNNLVITGLCGVHPSAGDTLELHPLVDSSIDYFCLSDLAYHGHKLTLVYDKEGTKYKLGKGLFVFVDGKQVDFLQDANRKAVVVGRPVASKYERHPVNQALNISRSAYPAISASVNTIPDSLYQAVDGRAWFFPEISNRWTTLGSKSDTDWYAITFDGAKNLSTAKISFFADSNTFAVPDSLTIEYRQDTRWMQAGISGPLNIVANTTNEVHFQKITADAIRFSFKHRSKAVAVVEVECYEQ